MNKDTKELSDWISSEEEYWNLCKAHMENELEFVSALAAIIDNIHIFKVDGNEPIIDSSKVNGNEIYMDFCELNGIETNGWK